MVISKACPHGKSKEELLHETQTEIDEKDRHTKT